MSELQIILIVIGILIICAVILINWWQERKFHKQVESSFSDLQSDALFDDPKLDVSGVFPHLDDADVKDFSIDPTFAHKAAGQAAFDADDSTSDRYAHDDRFQSEKFRDYDLEKNLLEKDQLEQDALENEQLHNAQFESSYHQVEESLDEVYTKLQEAQTDAKFKDPSDSKFADPMLSAKPDQHDDIKAIFNEAFSQTKNPVPFQYEDAETSIAKAHEEMAQYGDVKAEEPTETLPTMLHAQMDLTALLYLAADTPVSTLKSTILNLLDGYDKSVFVHVLDENKVWHDIKAANPSRMISRLACSIQLADRGGPISRQTLNRFQLAVETIGLDMNAHVEWQNSGDALTAATALDNFCLEVDKTMGFHLLHGENGAFTGTKLRGLAESQGFSLDNDGAFKYYEDHNNQPSFIMVNREQYPFSPDMLRSSVVKGITFQLDIPHVKNCAEAFGHMVQIARQMEIGLHATLVDDNNRPLGDIQIEKIRQQLKVIHATMLVRGITPGSDSAHRLFS